MKLSDAAVFAVTIPEGKRFGNGAAARQRRKTGGALATGPGKEKSPATVRRFRLVFFATA
jgi:hypothetical protein